MPFAFCTWSIFTADRGVKVLITSGIWPPDVGGPASHGPELGRFLAERGYAVEAVTAAGAGGVEDAPFPVRGVNRDRPLPLRLAAAGGAVASAARGKNVIYSAGLYTRSALAARLQSVPLVFKLASDPAYERAYRAGFAGSLQDFQREHRSPRIRYLKRQRAFALSAAEHVIVPSRYLAEFVAGWEVPEDRISVFPNPAPAIDAGEPRDRLRERLGLSGFTFVFTGRFVKQKSLPLLVDALRRVDGASLVLVGEGPIAAEVAEAIDRNGLRDRVSLPGAVSRAEAVDWMRAADAAVLPSEWENFPHAAVEALAAGTPVIATTVGGVPEIVESGVNGILVPAGDVEAFAAAMASVVRNGDFAGRLREAARGAAAKFSSERIYSGIAQELERAAATSSGRSR
jgi:glycosyltransferase involved in cell wall biosynthesis